MNRTALCIQMLELLKAHGQLSASQLANMLDTNPRNIREFRKELETSGYVIHEVRGRYGGYVLDTENLMPVLGLKEEEKQALQEARNFVEASPNFAFAKAAAKALDKIIASDSKSPEDSAITYVKNLNGLDVEEANMLAIIEKAIKTNTTVLMSYQSRQSDEPVSRMVDPYEVFSIDGSWYFVGYDRSHRDWRNYKISKYRMMSVKPVETMTFLRDKTFSLSRYIGTTSAFKQKLKEYTVFVRKSSIRLFYERYWGSSLKQRHQTEQGIVCTFFHDNPWQVYDQLFHMQGQVILLGPQEEREVYEQILESVLSLQKSFEMQSFIMDEKETGTVLVPVAAERKKPQ